jgi:hypothetical protein
MHNTGQRSNNIVPGVAVIQDSVKLRQIYDFAARVYGSPVPLSYNPCPLPVSLSKNQLEYIKQKENDYVVSEKTDGVRYQLILYQYLDGRQCSVMMDRNLNCYEVAVVAKRPFFQHGTIFDGELVWEYHAPSGTFYQTYIIFDVYICAGEKTLKDDYIDRMGCIHDLVAMDENVRDKKKTSSSSWETCAEQHAREGKIVSLGNIHSLIFITKPCFSLANFSAMLRNKSKFNSDGILFTPISEAVRFGRHPHMFKWKPHQTIDVSVSMQYDENTDDWILKSLLWDKTDIVEVNVIERMTLQITRNNFLDSLLHHLLHVKNVRSHTVLLEMDAEPDESSLTCKLFAVKRRVDKSHPKSVDTVTHTIKNIKENITVRCMLNLLEKGATFVADVRSSRNS